MLESPTRGTFVCLLDLPSEILNQCLQPLHFSDLCQVRATCRRLLKAVQDIHHTGNVTAEEFLSPDSKQERLYEKNYERLHFGNAHRFALRVEESDYPLVTKFPKAPIGYMTYMPGVELTPNVIGVVEFLNWPPPIDFLFWCKHIDLDFVNLHITLQALLLSTPWIQTYRFRSVQTSETRCTFSGQLLERKGALTFERVIESSIFIDNLHPMECIFPGVKTLVLEGGFLDYWVRSCPNLEFLEIIRHTNKRLALPTLHRIKHVTLSPEAVNIRNFRKKLKRAFSGATFTTCSIHVGHRVSDF